MSDIAIRVEHLSKQYHIGRKQEKYRTLRDTLAEAFVAPFRRAGRLLRGQATGAAELSETIWALRDVSFEVKRGEVIGIIGRNGAGKSTLLKILSRITEPTEGYAEIHGRVGSLLEVGTGFHNELTGRENIYLNGAILGMKRAEIDRKFDEIVAFAEVEKFIDTPVKHYSSGMYLRLAFAVAAHLEPEILLVDEVLAVGDAAFQKKCLGKMEDVAQEGRTVLFVSHNMSAVQALCPRTILLRQGQVALDGPTESVVREYLANLTEGAEQALEDNPERTGSGGVYLTAARVLDETHQPTRHLIAGRPASFELHYRNLIGAKRANVAMTIYNHLGIAVTNCDTVLTGFSVEEMGPEGILTCHIPNLPFPIGQYYVAVAIYVNGKQMDLVPNALVFDVDSSTFFKNGRTPKVRYCACMVSHQWQHETTNHR